MGNPGHKSSFFPALEGLRGIAIIAVIVFHNFPYGDSLFGWLGVDLFFVLSGFLITGILLRAFNEDTSKNVLRNFYMRRVLRIFPLYYLFLLVFLVLFPAFGFLRSEVTEYQENAWWFILYIQNWLFAIDFPEVSHSLNHFWSLAVEEQFYILWPLVILLLRSPRRLLVFLSIFLVALFVFRCIIWYCQISGFNYTTFYIFTRFDGICIGSMVAVLVHYKKDFLKNHIALIISSLAILNFLFYFLNTSGNLPYLAFIGYTTFAAMFGILVYELSYGKNSTLKKAFSIRPLRFLGRVSYGLYMFHWPIHYFLGPELLNQFSNNPNIPGITAQLLTACITTFVSIVCSFLSYRFFEKRFLIIKERFQ